MNCNEQDIKTILFVRLERTTLLMEIYNFIDMRPSTTSHAIGAEES